MRKAFLIVGASLGLVTLVAALVQRQRTERTWQEMLSVADELQASIDGAETRRPVLYGKALEGNAFDDYQRALNLMGESAEEDWRLHQAALKRGAEDAIPIREALLEEHQELLATLALGAHREHARPPMDWDDGYSASVPSLLAQRTMTNLLVLAARAHVDEGRPDLAVESLLDGMQLGRDHFHSPLLISSMIGCALLSISSKESLLEQGLLERLPPESLAVLAQGMQRLDEGMRMTNHADAGEIVMFVRSVERTSSVHGLLGSQPLSNLQTWRFGFSGRQMCAEYVMESSRRLDTFRRREGAGWAARKRDLQGMQADIEASKNPITAVTSSNSMSIETSLYGALANLRLTRAAVEHRLTGELPQLADPFGSKLRVRVEGEGLALESCGPEGGYASENYRVQLTDPIR